MTPHSPEHSAEPPPIGPGPGDASPSQGAAVARPRWHIAILRLCLILFTTEIGIVLVAFPWMSNWESNYFRDLLPKGNAYWDAPSFKGAVTGLGLVNLYVALLQVASLFRKPD